MKTMGLYMSKIGQVYKCNCGQMVDSVRIGRGHANYVSLASVDLSAVSQKKVTQVCCLERSHLLEGQRTGASYVSRTERSEERRVGQEGVSPLISGWSQYH